MSATLSLRDLSLRLGGFRLGPLSLELDAGDYLVLLGPSGCGKTSLLRAVAGVYRVDPGMLLLSGRDAGRLAPQERRVGYVSQTADLFPHMSVVDNIVYGLRFRGIPRAERMRRCLRVARMLEVDGLLARRPATLSGGEAKRVALARSLAIGPGLLLLDEPLSMLDHNARGRMLDLLRAVHEEMGTATVHVTHDREEAWALGARCAVMSAGQLEGQGPVVELFRRPERRFVAEFLGAGNLLEVEFEEREGGTFAVLEWASFEIAGPVDYPRGLLHVRPETLKISGPEDPGAFRAEVLSVSDRGAYRELRVRTPGGKVLTCHVVGVEGRLPSPGTETFLCPSEPPHPLRNDDA
ncbi:MAG: ABC transporter ATP-binding protein [Planctomycetota bacterium]